MAARIRGVLAPVHTPYTENLEPDVGRFIAHCRWLVDNNVGLAIFGTNSEAASLSVSERLSMTDALLEAGIPAARLMPGTGACALPDAVTLTKHAVENGASGALMLPPFFFKGVSDDGLYAYYSEVIERVGNDRLKVYLYHIPQVTAVPITMNLIEMLRKRYPDTVVGAKDSSGNWDNTQAMIDNFAKDGFDVFPASESTLSKALPLGAAGCISATVNMNPGGIHALYQGWNTPEGETVPIGKGQDASGGGRWFVIGSDHIWAVQNNGKDDDNWALNNVKTYGPGAIGARVPVEAELADSIKTLGKAAG